MFGPNVHCRSSPTNFAADDRRRISFTRRLFGWNSVTIGVRIFWQVSLQVVELSLISWKILQVYMLLMILAFHGSVLSTHTQHLTCLCIFWDCPIEFAHLSAKVRYSPFEFLPQDNTGKVADESQAEEAVKAHGVQSENSKSGGTHHPWKRLGFLSVELNVI